MTGLEGLYLLHFNGMETSVIALTDKVVFELDSQVLSCVKLILLTVACEYTSASQIHQYKDEFQRAWEWRRKAIDHKFPLSSKGLTAGCYLRA